MRTLLISLSAVAAFSMVPTEGVAADYELKGFTQATFQGNHTVRGYTEACQAEFSSDTRICNTIEVVQTVNWPSLPVDTPAWTHPVMAPNPQLTTLLDQGGVNIVGTTDLGYLSCSSWTSTDSSRFGATTWSEASFLPSGSAHINAAVCSTELPVACCGPVPAPAMAFVPAILWFGRGLLAAMILSAAAVMIFFRGQMALGRGERRLLRRG